MAVRAVSYGLGPIGQRIARLAKARSGIEIVGAIDVDPAVVGQRLDVVLGVDDAHTSSIGPDVIISADPTTTLANTRPDVVLHATGSSLVHVAPQLYQIAENGANIISTCEELSYPWTAQPQLAAELDAAARKAGITMLGTGVNPGYAMDALPLMFTAPCAEVRAIRVLRVVDAARRRGPLQRKVGAGLTTEEFAAQVRSGRVRHVGLPESLHMLAMALGWLLDRSDDSIEPIVAEQPITTEYVQVAAGQVAGVRQIARGFIKDRAVLTLELRMYVGAPDPQDTIEIDGDPPIQMTVAGGFQGDIATAAIVVNAIPSVLDAQPGLASMREIPLVHFWS